MDCQTNEQYLIETFGEFASNPNAFEFRRGHKTLIRQLVLKVNEIINENGYEIFQYKVTKRKRRVKQLSYRMHDKKNQLDEIQISESDATIVAGADNVFAAQLKRSLFEKVYACLERYSAFKLVETKSLDENTVDVKIAHNRTYGKVVCIICRDLHPEKKIKPKSVYYHESDEYKESSYWVISNFTAHLSNVHQLQPEKIDMNERKNCVVKIINECDDDDSSVVVCNKTEKHDSIENDSIILIEEKEVFDTNRISSSTYESNKNEDNWLYNQISDQIISMISVVLVNGDQQEQMICEVGSNNMTITVANIEPDGNCLFSALVHQIFQYPLKSSQHEKNVALLRNEVVNYILVEGNFESFQFLLQDRVHEINQRNSKPSKIINMEEKCKSYVRDVLSRNGEWGGMETIIAVSKFHCVNIIPFNESGPCNMISYNKEENNRTIALAYRLGYDKINRNHYDSVSDLTANVISNVADTLISRMN